MTNSQLGSIGVARYLIGAVIGAGLVLLVWAWLEARRPLPGPLSVEILTKMVPVELVREILVPGPERVVERVRLVTEIEEVPVERIVEVQRVVQKAADLGQLQARVNLQADKYEGLDEDGRLVRGWVGGARCDLRAEPRDPWVNLVDEPFSLTESLAQSTDDPRKRYGMLARRIDLALGLTSDEQVRAEFRAYRQNRRLGYWLSADWYDQGDEWEFGGGVAVRLGR